MDGGEGWRMVRCGEDNKSVVNQIMLRFRPIAPKPVTGGSRSDEALINKSTSVMGSKRRTKTKYVRVKKSEAGKEKMKEIDECNINDDNKRVVTLQLLPEIDRREDYSDGGSRVLEFDSITRDMNNNIQSDEWLSLSKDYVADLAADPTVVMGGGVVESWVTVELVTGSCMKAAPHQGFGTFICTDEELVSTLEEDTCPIFVSDGWNRVTWLNGAFRRMVMMTWKLPEIAVWLVTKEELLLLPCTRDSSAFTCQVKLMRYAKEKCYYSQMVPCDMWRMDGGGFTWRLDVQAALTLAVDAAPLHI